jgi:hypothetical protein
MNNKISLFMETTKKEPEETISEIQILLAKYGLRNLMMNYDMDGNVEAVSFTISENKTPYLLPSRYKPLLKLANERNTKYIKPKDELQCRRVAWRQVYRWIESQLAMVKIGMVEMEEIFLPYMMVDRNRTIFNLIQEKGIGLLSSGK